MSLLLGIDTGGTYTDAVLLDDVEDRVLAKAKALTTRPDLAGGVGVAIDAVLEKAATRRHDIAIVSLSTTLATNALVEGHGGRIALVFIGFAEEELGKSDLKEALGEDPVITLDGGHSHSGQEVVPFDSDTLSAALESIKGVSAVAVASKFATRNPDHEVRARSIIRDVLGVPVTCSHELSQSLGGPKRALTAVLNARLIGLIDRLVAAVEAHIVKRDISARLMVVRGDGALISAELARERPIETILSGPAASIAGAQWLSGAQTAIVSDIGGTTTDVCMLKDGLPAIDPQGAKVGKYRTMVEAVAMRTFGLGGDSEVCLQDGLEGDLLLGPRRVMPIALAALSDPEGVHAALDRALALSNPQEEATRFVLSQCSELPNGLDPREEAIMSRLGEAPRPWNDAVRNRVEVPALMRLVQRGLVLLAGVTPTDASHVLGRMSEWDVEAARKALTLFAARRTGSGIRLAPDAKTLAQSIIDQLTQQTVWALLETAFAEEGWPDPGALARHSLLRAGLDGHDNVLRLAAGLSVPIVGLGASAQSYYGAVGTRLDTETILPVNGGVANAIGAVVGQVAIHAEGAVTSAGEGAFRAHLPDGPQQFNDKDMALEALREALTARASGQARGAGVQDIRIHEQLDLREAQVEAQTLFVEATMRITARGRPRISG